MTEQAQKSNQQIIVIGLVVIAALLAAIVGVIVYQQSKVNSVPAPTTPTLSTTTGQSSGMGSTAAETPFDPKTATKVPEGMDPLAFVKAYHEDVAKGKWAEAYKMLPIDKQKSYGDAKAYEEQVKAYGITSYKLGKPATNGDTVQIAAEQVTPQMPVTYTWVFKKVGGQWYCASRQMGGTVQ